MGRWRNAWSALRGKQSIDVSNYRSSEPWFGTGSGATITHESSLEVTTVLACTRVISEDVAKLPVNIFEADENGSDKRAIAHPVHKLLTQRPNDFQTPFEFMEGLTLQAVLTGWGFAVKLRNSKGELVNITPVVSGLVSVNQLTNGQVEFVVTDTSGGVVGRFPPSQMLVLRGPIWDRYRALDVVMKAREAIGLAAVTESTQAKLHANGGRPSGILTTDTPLKPEALTRLKESWQTMHGGIDNSFKTAVLDNGLKFQPLTQTGVDGQHLETRRLQIEEVCRAMKVFPQMVGHSDKTATFASAEAFFAAHFRHTVWPWLERWKQVISRDLIVQKNRYYAEFDTANFSRASLADRSSAYRDLIETGVYTRNEIRTKFEGLEALPGLDEPLTPLNMEGTNEDEDA